MIDIDRSALSRRGLLKAGASAAAGMSLLPALAACGDDDESGGQSAGGSIRFSSWGGEYSAAWKTAIVKPFTAATGIKVSFDDAPGEHLAKLRAQEQAHRVMWDVVEATFLDYFPLVEHNLVQPLPEKLVAKLKPISLAGAVAKYGVAAGVGANGVVVSAPSVKPAPMSPAEFWDIDRFPGARGMWKDGALDNVVSALLADGVPTGSITPLDLDRAFKKLDEIRPQVEVFWTSGDQLEQIIRDREVDMTLGWDGRAWKLKQSGTNATIGYDGALIEGNFLMVPKGAQNPKGAFEFIEYYGTHPKEQAAWITANLYTTSNKNVGRYLEPKIEQTLWFEHDENVVLLNPDTFDVDVKALQDRWYDWLEG